MEMSKKKSRTANAGRRKVASSTENIGISRPVKLKPAVAVRTKIGPEQAAPPMSETKQPEARPQPASAPTVANGPFPAGCADIAAIGRDNLAAMARANAAFVKGVEEIGQEFSGYAQRSLANGMDMARALVGVRTVSDLVALNRTIAQTTIETALANSARLSEIGIRVANETLGPINECIALTFGRRGRPAR